MEQDDEFEEFEVIEKNSQLQKQLYEMGLTQNQCELRHTKNFSTIIYESFRTTVLSFLDRLQISLRFPFVRNYLYNAYHSKKHKDFKLVVKSLLNSKFLDYSERLRIFSIADDLETDEEMFTDVKWISSILSPQSISSLITLIDNCSEFNSAIKTSISYLQDFDYVTHANFTRKYGASSTDVVIFKARRLQSDEKRRNLRNNIFRYLSKIVDVLQLISNECDKHFMKRCNYEEIFVENDSNDCSISTLKAVFTLYKLYLSEFFCLYLEKVHENADHDMSSLCYQASKLNTEYHVINKDLLRIWKSIERSTNQHEDIQVSADNRSLTKCRELKLKLEICIERIETLENYIGDEDMENKVKEQLIGILGNDLISCNDCCDDLAFTIIGKTNIEAAEDINEMVVPEVTVHFSEDASEGCEPTLCDAIFEGEADQICNLHIESEEVDDEKVQHVNRYSSEKILRELRNVIHLRECYKSEANARLPTFGLYGTIRNAGDKLPHCLEQNRNVATSEHTVTLDGDLTHDPLDDHISEVRPVISMSISDTREICEALKSRDFDSNLCTTYGDESDDNEYSIGGDTSADDNMCSYEYKKKSYSYSSTSSDNSE